MAKLEAATIENAGSLHDRIKATFVPPESDEQPTQETPEATTDEVEFQAPETEEAETLEADSDYEESDEDTPDEAPTYKVKVNGEEVEVSLDDLQKGYMMESDYRQKTSKLAETRKALDEKLDTITNLIEDGEASLALELEDLESRDMLELKEDDPAAYYAKREAVQKKVEKLTKLKDVRKERAQEAWNQRVATEQEALQNALPEWLDENKAKQDLGLINDLWTSYGFTEQDLGQFVDHRLILLSREAALYRKLKNAKPESKRVKQPPKSVKPSSTETSGRKSKTPADERRNALKQSGKLSQAAQAIKDLI